MKSKYFFILALSVICIPSIAQDAKKMAKNLRVTPTEFFDKSASISFDRKNPAKHGFEDISAMFKNAFVTKQFTVQENSKYLLVMDYDYAYVISAYRYQYSNLTAEIIDLSNNRTVVATIIYKGRFEIDAVADAVAAELAKAKLPKESAKVLPEAQKTTTPVNTTVTKTKTKEEKLVELKQFYEKQLITKEEYEEQKKKVLAE